MRVEIRIDSSVTEPKVVILTDQMNEEISEIVRKLSDTESQVIAGFQNDMVTLLDRDTILRIYTANGKVFAATERGEYLLRLRLYELEARLRRDRFVRISNSEIINLKKVRHFDLSFAGTIRVSLSDGASTYVSRRYVSKIKDLLGL